MKKVEVKYQVPGYLIGFIIIVLVYQFSVPVIKNFKLVRKIEGLINYDRELFDGPPEIWDVKEQIELNARYFKIPLAEKDIKITAIENGYEVSIEYTYEVNLIFVKVPWKFQSTHITEV
ncbi:hypothetical protein ACFL27_08280 [candidate division CSSED10-310 bacterium]|uniref:DUF4845 domain-containing protein n=1 Tax=candidate division CSSED10-310 bacterium TaxID=2855610 RepID=A0ABV6YVG3_UNCC1